MLLRSRDGGLTWEARSIPGASRQNPPFIAAVHPTNPNVVYVRVQGAWNGTDNVQSWLLYTDDAGESFREIFRAEADMLGFALTPDGGAALVGLGDTHDLLRPVDRTVLGIYRATAPGFDFSRTFQGQVGCLSYSGSRLLVCGGHASDKFELGVSSDDGDTITPLLDYGHVEGPLSCPKATPEAMICAPAWPYSCAAIASCSGSADSGIAKGPDDSGSSGCCGSASKPRGFQTGTARLDMLPGSEEALVGAGVVLATLLRRRYRRRR